MERVKRKIRATIMKLIPILIPASCLQAAVSSLRDQASGQVWPVLDLFPFGVSGPTGHCPEADWNCEREPHQISAGFRKM